MKKYLLFLLLLPSFCFADYGTWRNQYIGVPKPSFGYEEDVVTLYGAASGATYDYSDDEPTGATAYRLDANNDPYTDYVYNDGGITCTDVDNPHGTHTTPRCSMPESYPASLGAGQVIFLKGTIPIEGTDSITSAGTAEAPLFIRGNINDKPVWDMYVSVANKIYWNTTGYGIIENIDFDMSNTSTNAIYLGATGVAAANLAVRDCIFRDGNDPPSASYQAIRMKLQTDQMISFQLPFDSGSEEPTPGDTLENTYGIARITYVSSVVTSGAWGTGDAAGIMYVRGEDAHPSGSGWADDAQIDIMDGTDDIATVNGSKTMYNNDFSASSDWADVDLADGGGSYDETDDLSLVAGAGGSGDYATLAATYAPLTNGVGYILTVDVTALSGTWTLKSADGTETFGQIAATGNRQQFEFTAEGSGGGLRVVADSNGAEITIDNIYINKNLWVQNVVIFRNVFKDLGENWTTLVKNDAVGVSLDSDVKNVWILENKMYRLGDGSQFAWDGYQGSHSPPQYIYFAKNEGWDAKENLLDLKGCQDVIVSQNIAHNMGPEASVYSGDTSIPYRYGSGEGAPGFRRSNIWSLYNLLYDYDGTNCGYSSYSTESAGNNISTYFIGNIAINGHSEAANSMAFCISYNESGGFINNTAYDNDTSFYFVGDTTDSFSSESLIFTNNISSNVTTQHIWLQATVGSLGNWTFKNNIFDSSNSTVLKYWYYPPGGGSVTFKNYTDFADFCDTDAFDGDPYPNFCVGSSEVDPKFISASNFRLQSDSTAINAGSNTELLAAQAAFYARYGVSIDFDNDRWPRISGATVDMGAFEYNTGTQPVDLTGSALSIELNPSGGSGMDFVVK